MAIQSGDGTLNLSKCHLEEIPLQVIRDYYDPTPLDLDISWNKICAISPEFSLNFSNNNIKTLPENFGLLTDLVYLDLSNNQVKKRIKMMKLRKA